MHYAEATISVAKLRESLVSEKLNSRLHRLVLDLKLNPQYIDHMGINDFVAKACNLGAPTPDQDWLWLFTSVHGVFIFEFDDHFDKPRQITPECVAKRAKSPIYTRPLNRFRNRFNTKPVMCKRTNSVWKPVYVIHLRMWFESGLKLD